MQRLYPPARPAPARHVIRTAEAAGTGGGAALFGMAHHAANHLRGAIRASRTRPVPTAHGPVAADHRVSRIPAHTPDVPWGESGP